MLVNQLEIATPFIGYCVAKFCNVGNESHIITLFISITVFCGIENILENIPHIQWESYHNIIQTHNNVLWDWQYFTEYSPYLVCMWEYSAEYYQSHRTLLWIWIMLWWVHLFLLFNVVHWTFANAHWHILEAPVGNFFAIYCTSNHRLALEIGM